MVKMEPITKPKPPSKLDFLEFLQQEYLRLCDYYDYEYGFYKGYEYDGKLTLLAEYNYDPSLADLANTSDNLWAWFEEFQSDELRKNIFEEYFYGDWRLGQEVHKVVITQRLYQTSPNSTQA